MTHAVHLSEDLIGRVVDDELTPTERLFVERHLAKCAACRQKRREWAEVAERVQDLVLEQEPFVPANARQRLVSALEQREPAQVVPIRPDAPAWWKWGAVAAVAASLAFMLSLPPVRTHVSELLNPGSRVQMAAASGASQPGAEETERSFIPLPYSGVELAEGQEEIVRVQLPASALANQGIILPGAYAENSLVDADLLLGLDGQPQGIRLVNADEIVNY
ncbi:MAG: zf-HC2 domain-containing protein [Bryobacteraceae bacterium]